MSITSLRVFFSFTLVFLSSFVVLSTCVIRSRTSYAFMTILFCENYLSVYLSEQIPFCQFRPLVELADPIPEHSWGKYEKKITLLKSRHLSTKLKQRKMHNRTNLIHILGQILQGIQSLRYDIKSFILYK